MRVNPFTSTKKTNHILKRYPELSHTVNLLAQRSLNVEGTTVLRKILKKYIEGTKKQGILKKKCETKPKLRRSVITRNIYKCLVENLFKCPICKEILDTPVTIACGHTYCRKCLNLLGDEHYGRCIECEYEIEMKPNTCANILVKNIVERWKPEKDSYITSSANKSPELRYCLRSRCSLGCNGFHNINSNTSSSKICKRIEEEDFNRSRGDIQTSPSVVKKKWLKIISLSDIECIVCSFSLYEPITTSCGHTFCRECLGRVFDHNIACPLCNTKLNITDQFKGETLVLTQALKLMFPKEWETLSNNPLPLDVLEENREIPIFICTNAFPKVACPLFVYEPRYRLLSRRSLQSGKKRFGMAAKSSNGEFPLYGTLIEIKDCVNFEDGTSILTAVGLRRFKITEKDTQDGYDTAVVHYIRDSIITPEKFPSIIKLHATVYKKTREWLGTMKYRLLVEIERCLGPLPSVEVEWHRLPDGPYWVWWLIAILPLNLQLRVGFLACTNLEKRLLAIEKMLDHMKVRNYPQELASRYSDSD